MTIFFDKQRKMDEKEKTAAIAEVPEEFRETYACLLDEWEALNMQEVLRLSEILEDTGADETLWAFQKATAYLDMDLPKQAERCIDELYSVYPDNPEILLIKAICRQQNGDVNQAERLLESIYPPEEYNPFYYSVYGSVLEEREKRTEAYEQYRVAYEHFRDGYPSNKIFMDGIFQRMIELDMDLELDTVGEDVDAYIAFLKGIQNTEEWQCQVNENLMLFSQYMPAEKNREPLCRLVSSLLDFGFMTSELRLRELRLLARSPEVCAMIGDPKISKFTSELVEQTILIGSMEDREADETLNMKSDAAEELWEAQTEAAMLKYYAVKRLPGILDEFEYIRSAYPHIYETLADFAGELREDPVKTAGKYREIFRERTGKEKFTVSSLDRFYKETYESGNVMWSSDGGSYVRTEKKVGRNDPCPCGSGKKYKRCCGRK